MISKQMLAFIQAFAIICAPSLSHPVYGTKRYNNGRAVSPGVRMFNDNYSWGTPVLPYQQFPRTQRVVNYYDPYTQDYQDDYYSQSDEPITYPIYIPAPRTSKYEVYQAVLPYYYGQRASTTRPKYGYYFDQNTDPLRDIEKEMKQAEIEERENAQPIGKEVLYENEPDDADIGDVNAAFVQNLIMAQMYQNSKDPIDNYDPDSDYYYYDDEGAGHWTGAPDSPTILDKEDKDVRELKQLAKLQKPKAGPTIEDRMSMFRKEKQKTSDPNVKRNAHKEVGEYGTVVYGTNDLPFSDRKPIVSTTSTTPPKAAAKSHRKDNKDGQKEEVLMRPAEPARRPFVGTVGTVHEHSNGEQKREPSVYDTIKHMLDMERSLENDNRVNDLRPPMRKRIISSEDSLTHQLSTLKKTE